MLRESQSPERAALIVIIRVAHRTLKRYCQGETEVLRTLSPQVAEWLEFHEYIHAVIDEEGSVEYEITPKGRRAVLGSDN